jgi:hypothetical protein
MIVKIKGMAILYNDSSLENQLDIFNPEIPTKEELVPLPEDLVTLVRDPMLGDMLIRVETTRDKILLNHNAKGELSSVDVMDIDTNKKKSDVTMIYGDYVNHQGETENVLTQVRTRNTIVEEEK